MRLWPFLGEKRERPGTPERPMDGLYLDKFATVRFQLPATPGYDPKKALANSIVEACIDWLATALASVNREVVSPNGRPFPMHPLMAILERPNGDEVFIDFLRDVIGGVYAYGAAPVEILRDDMGRPIGLNYVSFNLLQTRRDGQWQTSKGRRIAEDSMTVFVWGVDQDENVFAPLSTVNRFLQADDAAAENSYGRMKSPVLGIAVQPDKDAPPPTPQQRQSMKDRLLQFTGIRAGEPAVIEGQGKILELKGPQQAFDFTRVHNSAEERTCALFRLPPSVVQLGTGLEATRVGATMTAEVRMAWEHGVQAMASRLEEWFTWQLLPFWNLRDVSFKFDLKLGRYVSEQDRTLRATRTRADYQAGLITYEEFRRINDYE